VTGGYLPLEKIDKMCPLCGFGELKRFEQSHRVFGNPNPRGIEARKCTHCGYCFAIDTAQIKKQMFDRPELD
ncbi:MAG: hypothetical protein ACOC9S_07450, partial [Planctomycetota bacterium]